MELLLTSALLGLATSLVGGPYARKYLLESGIYGIDQQKKGKPKIPTSGGILVFFSFAVAVTAFLGLSTLFTSSNINVALVLAAFGSVNIITLIGVLDDIHINTEGETEEIETRETPTEVFWDKITSLFGEVVEREKEDDIHREGLGQLPKMLFVLPAVLPLIAVGAGSWTMSFPVFGQINWGLIYPLFLLPVGLLFVSNVINMLAGTNGLSAGMSIVAATGLGIFAILNQRIEAALIAFALAGSLLGFLYYNWFPADILPGDSLTYLSGAALFSAMVVGNIEKFGLFIFAPWFLEFFLKLRSGFNAHSWGELTEDGTLKSHHEKIYSLTHIPMRKDFTEKQVTISLILLEVVIVVFSLALFVLGPL